MSFSTSWGAPAKGGRGSTWVRKKGIPVHTRKDSRPEFWRKGCILKRKKNLRGFHEFIEDVVQIGIRVGEGIQCGDLKGGRRTYNIRLTTPTRWERKGSPNYDEMKEGKTARNQ